MFVPNLNRLAHRPSPTGVGPPRTRARAREAQAAAQAAVLGNTDLLAQILAALNTESGSDDACAMAMSYCAAQQGACAEDTWRALLALVFPTYAGPLVAPKAKFLALCRRWDRGRKFRYEHDLALHGGMVPPDGLVPVVHLARIVDWFSSAHSYAFQDDEDYQEYLWGLQQNPYFDDDYDNHAVWYLVNFLATDNFQKIAQMLHGGMLHVSNDFEAPPMDVYGSRAPQLDAFAFDNWGNQKNADDEPSEIRLGNPRTLLGLLLTTKARVAHVRVLLRTYGADPNAKFSWVEHLAFKERVIPPEDLNYDDEGAAECLALRHIYAIMGRKLNFGDVNPYEVTTVPGLGSLVWFDRVLPGEALIPVSLTIRGERSIMLDYYRLLYDYGGDVYNAAMMYRAYGEEFNDFCARDMADEIEKFARFVTTSEGTVPITDALRTELLDKHRARLRRRCPYHDPLFHDDDAW